MDAPEDTIKVEDSAKSIDLAIPGCAQSKLYVKPNTPKQPKWANLFADNIDVSEIGKSSSVSAALFVKIKNDSFVLTFGYGRHLVREDTCEERFGLICTLNSVHPNSLRCVDIQSLDAIQSHSRIQSGLEIPADQFGLNVEQDMLKAVVGAPSDGSLGARMTGTDALSVSVRMDLTDLAVLLRSYRDQYHKDLSATNYAWVNNINLVKGSSSLVPVLDEYVVAKFKDEDYEDLWLAIPEIIDWNHVSGFKYQAGGKAMYPDINLEGFLSTISPKDDLTCDLLRNRKVYCVDEDHNRTGKSWSIYKCLYAEVEHDGQKYIFNGGLWYRVDKNFVTKTNQDYSKIPISSLSLPLYSGGGEGSYNQSVAATDPDRFDLLDDKKKVFHGGGHGQVEICDLFTKNRELIHVKRYGKSTVLSHLFAQGFVSGQLLQLDPEFRKKVAGKLSDGFSELIDVDERPADKAYTIVYAIISESMSPKLHLPFFSRVNLNNTFRQLDGFGYKVELLRIGVDPEYSKTKKLPPEKEKKL